MWTRLDDGFFIHPKARKAGKDGRAMFLAGLCYAAGQLRDGFIPNGDVPLIAALAEVDEGERHALVTAGLWEEVPNGYQIHDWLDFNPTKDEITARRNERREAGKKGGEASAVARAQAKGAAIAQAKSNQTPILEKKILEKKNKSEEKIPAEASGDTKSKRARANNFSGWAEALWSERHKGAVPGWTAADFIQLAESVKAIGEPEARRRWSIYLDETDAFYRGHSPRKWRSELSRWVERNRPRLSTRHSSGAKYTPDDFQ